MTTGVRESDARIPYYSPYAGNIYIGFASKRNWNGDNSPARPLQRYERTIKRYESHMLNSHTQRPFVIPEYHKRVNDPNVVRQRAENNYSVTYQVGRGQLFYVNGAYLYGFGNVSPPPTNDPETGLQASSPGSVWTANDDIALVNRLRQAMLGSDFDPAVFLATSNESLRMIFQAARKIDRSFQLIRKGQISSAAQMLCSGTQTKAKSHRNFKSSGFSLADTAKAQLELSYGWLPLLSDAYHGAHYVAHNTQLARRGSFRARYSRSFVQFSSSPSIFDFPDQRSRVRGQLIARMREDFAFSQQYLLGLDDPLGMAWERLPWSFVADWFIPIQDYMTARQLARQVKGTFIKTTSKTVSLSRLRTLVGNYSLTAPHTFYYRGVSATRSVSSTLDVPRPQLKSLSSVPSWRRALNAVSLLTVRFK